MKSSRGAFALLLGALYLLMTSAGCVLMPIDAGHEGVLVEKPFFFGHGGVDPVPATTGRIRVAPTTQSLMSTFAPVSFRSISISSRPKTRRFPSTRTSSLTSWRAVLPS